MDQPPEFISVFDARALLRAGRISPLDLVSASLARIEKYDATLLSFIMVDRERALDRASRLTLPAKQDGAAMPLCGIPFSLKDVIDVKGIPTTGHSRYSPQVEARTDSDIYRILKRQGAILVGKNTAWEYAHGGPSWDVLLPPARNPWDTRCHASGSSSGSAVAVAAGIVPFAFGTDTGGSIRNPAAVCGIAGFKPTFGLISTNGVIPNSFSQDHVGPIARTVKDIAIIMDAVQGGAARSFEGALSSDLAACRIGFPRKWLDRHFDLSDDTLESLLDSVSRLEGLGATIVELDLPDPRPYDDVKKIIAMADLYNIHHHKLAEHEKLGNNFFYRIIAGGLITASEYISALRVRDRIVATFQTTFSDVDLVVLPTTEPATELKAEHPGDFLSGISLTSMFNVTGNPALSICNGFSKGGLPTSLQIVGPLFGDVDVINCANALEETTRYHEATPNIQLIQPGQATPRAHI